MPTRVGRTIIPRTRLVDAYTTAQKKKKADITVLDLKKGVHQPRIERGADRWQRSRLPLPH